MSFANQNPSSLVTPKGIIYIAEKGSPGINAAAGSLAHTLAVVEMHHHPYMKLFGKKVSPTTGVRHADPAPDVTTEKFVMQAGSNTWGTEIYVFGTDDFIAFSGKQYFDIAKMIITATGSPGTFYIQFAHGTGTAAAAFADFSVTSTNTIILPTAISDSKQFEIGMGRPPTGHKVWARAWHEGNLSDVDFLIGLHFYENGA